MNVASIASVFSVVSSMKHSSLSAIYYQSEANDTAGLPPAMSMEGLKVKHWAENSKVTHVQELKVTVQFYLQCFS